MLFMMTTQVAFAQTPTPTPPPGVANITLSSGQTVAVEYRWTFGEIVETGALLTLIVITVARWVYDVIVYVWNQRRTIVVEDQ